MAVPKTKDELLAAIESTFAKLDVDLDRVPEEEARELVLEGHVGGSMMSAADLVAYLIGWNRQVLAWHSRRLAGESDEFPARGIQWNQLGLLAQRYYAEHADDSWSSLRSQLADAKAHVVDLIQGYSAADLYNQPSYGKWTMGRMISLNTSSPYDNARRRMRVYLRGV